MGEQAGLLASSTVVPELLAAGAMTNQQVTTLASLLEAAALLNQSELTISEDDELKLLNFPSRREDLSTAIPLTIIFALLLVTGCIGNICTAIVIARPKNKYMHTATNYYLFSLAMSDLLFLILGLPQEMYTLWQRYPYAMGESFCIARGYLSEASTYASILTISAFTIERYVAICHPLWAHTMSQLPRAITSIVIIWICAAICAIPPAAELGIVTQRGPISNRTLEQSAQCATKRTIFENMFVVSAIVFFIVPMIIVTVLYILIALELRRSSRMNNAISKQTSSGQHQPATALSSHSGCGSPAGSGQAQHAARGCARLLHAPSCPHAHHKLVPGRPLVALTPSVSSSLIAADAPQTPAAGARNCSLMANIMSQRPSSAIGNEQACCQLALPTSAGQLHSAAGSPPAASNPSLAGSWTRFQLPASKIYNHLLGFVWACEQPVKRQLEQSGSGEPIDKSELVMSGEASERASSKPDGNNNQSEPAPPPPPPPQQDHGHEALSRQHSPLSYHESLMQRHAPHMKNVVQHQSIDNVNLSQLLLAAPGSAAPIGQAATCQQLQHACQLHCHQKLLNHHYQAHNHHHHHRHHHHLAAPLASQQSRRSNAASSKKSVIRMLVAVVVSFFICWLPFHAQRLLASYLAKDANQDQLLIDIYLKLTYISGVMYYLSSTINPLLYQLMSAKFRLAFKETFKCSLLKCAFFARRSSSATVQATTCLVAGHPHNGHSPTNSIREHHYSHANQSLASTPLPPITSSGRLAGECCACCACCCASGAPNCSMRFAQPLPPASALARLRGRLNSSLTSLLKLQTLSDGYKQQNKLNSSCSCLTSRHHSDGASAPAPANFGLVASLSSKDKRKLLQANQTSGSRCSTPPANNVANTFANQLTPVINMQQLASSAPLLADKEAGSEAADGTAARLTAQNFPTHHTMLKFVRSSTPGSCKGGAVQPLQSLTRLSSREDEEGEDVQAAPEDCQSGGAERRVLAIAEQEDHDEDADENEALAESRALISGQDPLLRQKMGALIRPSQQKTRPLSEKPTDEEEDANENDELIATTSTESSGQSSAGTSPDQLVGQNVSSTPNTTTTATATSSSSSLSVPLSRQRRAHLDGMQAEFCSGPLARRQQLMASKSEQTRIQLSHSNKERPNHQGAGMQLRKQAATRRRSLQQTGQFYVPLRQTGNYLDEGEQLLGLNDDTGVQLKSGYHENCLHDKATEPLKRQRHRSSSSANQALNGNSNYLSSSVSSSEVRLDLLSRKRLSSSTTTTSVLGDDNSSLLTNNSQLISSNPNLYKAPKLISQSNNKNNNNTSNEDDHEIEGDPSTVIKVNRDLMLSNGAQSMSNLIV